MNEREKIFYLIGLIGDSTINESIEALKDYTKLDESEIKSVINEIIELNNNFKKSVN